MPQAVRAGMDCQTFWRSNPKRLKQFCDGCGYAEDVDLRAWATGYYLALAFTGKLPKSPDLLTVVSSEEIEKSIEDEAEKMALQFEAWTQINNQRFKHTEEVASDG